MDKRIMGIVGSMKAVIGKGIEEVGWWLVWKWFFKRPFLAVALPLKELLDADGVHDEATHMSPFLAQQLENEKDQTLVQALSSTIGMVFRAIHFLSWHSIFPTHVELMLWRTSSIVLAVLPFLLLLRAISTYIHRETPDGSRQERIANILYPLCHRVSFFLGPIPYILARFCVLVLSFLSLRNLPPDALINVSWTSYIPHL